MLKDRRVARVRWCGEAAFAKRPHRLRPLERLVLASAGVLRRWLAPEVPFTPTRRLEALPFEAQRLAELRLAGWRVPRLLTAGPGVLVIGDAGTPVEDRMTASFAERTALARRAAALLAEFHLDGQWHGGAQVRNLVVDTDDCLVRIDFDVPLDQYLPVPMLQAYDALLFLSSLARWPEVIGTAAEAYFEQAPADAVVVLRRGLPWLQRLSGWGWLHRVAPKEARRLNAVATALRVIEAPAAARRS